jgi:iron-sulfur cluster assembly protein
MYVVKPAEDVGEDDHVFESNGVRIVVDRESLGLLKGTELDFTREGLNEGFKFRNPNVKDTCGCGESFSV